MELNWEKIDKLIKTAFDEDLGNEGDITSNALIPGSSTSTGEFISKGIGIIAGIEVVKRCFELFDKEVSIEVIINDGDRVLPMETIMKVAGKTRSLLAVERTALNFLGHLSGISTITSDIVKLVKTYGNVVMDTRKTTPGYRQLEKYAARIGGATNHRMGLYDGILVKENHIAAAGSIKQAVLMLKKAYPGVKIEVEAEDLEQLRQAISAGADVVMLDNVDPRLIKKAAKMTHGEVKLEASGGVTIGNVIKYAETNADCISMGQITSSAPRLDISFLID